MSTDKAGTSLGRLILLCGASGSGKTTVAETLKKDHDWLHFDGNAWQYGLDPVTQSASIPTPDQVAACPKDIKAVMDPFVNDYYMKRNAGEEGDFSACKNFYVLMLRDIVRYRQEFPQQDMIITHAILEKKTRDLFRDTLGADLSLVLGLNVSPEQLGVRKLKRIEAQAAEKKQTVKEFLMSYDIPGLPVDFESRMKIFVDPGKAAQEALHEEEAAAAFMVEILEGDDSASVFTKVQQSLGLRPNNKKA